MGNEQLVIVNSENFEVNNGCTLIKNIKRLKSFEPLKPLKPLKPYTTHSTISFSHSFLYGVVIFM